MSLESTGTNCTCNLEAKKKRQKPPTHQHCITHCKHIFDFEELAKGLRVWQASSEELHLKLPPKKEGETGNEK